MITLNLWPVYILLSFSFVVFLVEAAANRSPIVIVPGDGGSRIYAKLDLDVAPGPLCTKKTDDFEPLWVYLSKVIGGGLDCTVHNMQLVYNATTHTTTDVPGVTTSIPGFGETYTIESLTIDTSIGDYFSEFVKAAIGWGYIRGQDLRGAPYDFRKPPNEFGNLYTKLKYLIEETHDINGQVPVTLIAHSYGCPTTLYFLNQQSQEWKTKYVRRFMSMGGPYGGTTDALKSYVSGSSFGEPPAIFPPETLRPLERTFPSSAFMLPSKNFWAQNEPLVVTPKNNYTAWNYEKLFSDMQQLQLINFYHDTKDLIANLTPPGVETHCMYGSGVSTDGRYVFMTELPTDKQPIKLPGLGDGTINKRSLEGCLLFKNKQNQPVYDVPLPGVEHFSMVKNADVIAYVKKFVLG